MERLVGERGGDVESTANSLVVGTRLERLREDHRIAELAREGLRLGHSRGLLGYAPDAAEGTRLS